MKRILLFVLLIDCIIIDVMAQDVMVIEKTDNTTEKYNVSDIKSVYFEKGQSKEGGNLSPSFNLETYDIADIEENTAEAHAYFEIQNAVKECIAGFFISTDSKPTNDNYIKVYTYKLSNANDAQELSAKITDLIPGTKYYVRPYILYDGAYYYGSITSFTTKNTPTFNITTNGATDIEETTANVYAFFDIQNAVKAYEIGFFVSTNSTPTSTNSTKYITDQISDTNYSKLRSSKADNLTPGTMYYVRPYILYDGAYYYGLITSFTTKKLTPTFNITINGATDIEETTANVYAYFDIQNAVKAYEIGFFVSTNATPTSDNSTRYVTDKLSDVNYSKLRSSKAENLKPGTTYNVRPYIYYDETFCYGTTKSFTTKKAVEFKHYMTIPNWLNSQAGVCYKNFLITARAMDELGAGEPNGYLYNLETGSLICSLTFGNKLGNKSYKMPHGNQMCFGKDFYNSNSKFPLLYVSQTTLSSTGSSELGVLVYDIQKVSEKLYTPVLVQVIIPDKNDAEFFSIITKWTTNYVVDTDTKKLYVFGYPRVWDWQDIDNSLTGDYPVAVFNLPKLSDGEAVVLDKHNLLEHYKVYRTTCIQQIMYENGRIYIQGGIGGKGHNKSMDVLDVKKKKIVSSVNLNDRVGEPQGLFIYKNKILWYDAGTNGIIEEFIF